MSPKKDETIEPIDDDFDNVVEIVSNPAPSKSRKNKSLVAKNAAQPAGHPQGVLDLGIEVQKNVNGIEMGVLENGIPYLTQTGLANLAGAARLLYAGRQTCQPHINFPISPDTTFTQNIKCSLKCPPPIENKGNSRYGKKDKVFQKVPSPHCFYYIFLLIHKGTLDKIVLLRVECSYTQTGPQPVDN